MKLHSTQKAKGRILRVKHGYNPNSSSLGSIVFALPASLLGTIAGFGAVSAVILSFFMKKPSEQAETDTVEDSDLSSKEDKK